MPKLFVFSNASVLRTTLLDEQDHPIYKIHTPKKLLHSTTTITRYSRPSSQEAESERDEEEMARIHWRYIQHSRLVLEGKIFTMSNMLERTGFCGRDRKFTAPDGLEYKWVMRRHSMKLVLNDTSDTVVVKFHEGSPGFFSPKRRSYLEIFPNGQHMIDIIVSTFVYLEWKRRESRR
ncbi:hypothetical protein JAAARDRAFT_38674 [Jaapia argillacea MUCL 33604]|uniref:DUF6593 domain-containing protein n=1 Tax=Jaapia argillacea MUCL 33604 TaxID=933084 RepID=A0A067PGM9_9AGAM|nr:hypothetical protein JAAARDRAFT_38674 [Jaapia argillacea MUCL 33604]